ncbi:MAG: TetR/AcrR family transcriptional regulator [Chloroflexia bacterium]|nr:TetR/AcrR family transcriptional regulator [Chloroflexia bacterium]
MLTSQGLTGASARRERGRQEMRVAILEAAARIMETDGIDGLTIRAVAEAVAYSPGALYEYFDSKEAILKALYFGGADGLGAQCERAVASLPPESSAIDAIVALGRAYRAYALDHPDLYRLVFGGWTTPPLAAAVECEEEESRGGFGTLADVASRGIAEGTLVDLPPAVIAVTTWATVHGFVSLELTGHLTGGDGPGMPPASPEVGRQTRDQLFEALLRMALYGFAREEKRMAAEPAA